MFHISYRLLQNREDAEEIVQNAFITVFSDIHKLKKTASFGSWLKKIVVHQSLNQIRKKKPEFIEVENLDLCESEDVPETLISPHLLWEFINELPLGSRTIIQLYLVESYKHREIADMLKISISTSKSQYQRAINLLRKKCEEVHHE